MSVFDVTLEMVEEMTIEDVMNCYRDYGWIVIFADGKVADIEFL